MTKILSIGTAVPEHAHRQDEILRFMQRVYALDETENRKLRFLYRQGGIEQRYSVVPDYSRDAGDWLFFSPTENLEPFPRLELRMSWFNQYAAGLSAKAIRDCVQEEQLKQVTHLVTVSCTGMSAPGLDIDLMRLLQLSPRINRHSINFMGCYAAIHAMKYADAICRSDDRALVLIVCTELCTLHFQREPTPDNITSSMLFGDGSAAMLLSGRPEATGAALQSFYGLVADKGLDDMSWQLSSKGFLMTLSSYVPALIEADFRELVDQALDQAGLQFSDIDGWCIHPGGKKILEAVAGSLQLPEGSLMDSYQVLRNYGNMSSPTVLFVLRELLRKTKSGERIFGAAFGPGLTMETFILSL